MHVSIYKSTLGGLGGAGGRGGGLGFGDAGGAGDVLGGGGMGGNGSSGGNGSKMAEGEGGDELHCKGGLSGEGGTGLGPVGVDGVTQEGCMAWPWAPLNQVGLLK
jgi:endoglycosylceramidase